ncbi:hypothetical protein [Candidatus Hodarchaeum mangrovi]
MTNKEKSTKIDRIYTFDFIRGGAIIAVVFIHRILWDYYFGFYSGGAIHPEIAIMYLFITMAGIFYVISGAVNAYMIYKRLITGQIKSKLVIISGWIMGLLMIGYSFFYRAFLIRFLDDSMPVVIKEETLSNGTGILPYLLLFGRLPDPPIPVMIFFGMGTLSMIGVIIIFISTSMGFLHKMNGMTNRKIIYGSLTLIGIMIFIISPFLRIIIGETIRNEYLSGNLLLAFFMEPLTNGMMPIFPHLSYGCFGAIVGIAIAREEKPRTILTGIGIFALTTFIAGIMFIEEPTSPYGFEPFTWEASIALMAQKSLQLGMFFFLIFLGLALLDYRSPTTREKWAQVARKVPDFGKLALTVYMWEGVLAAALQVVIRPLWSEWNASFLNITIFALINILVWSVILMLWERVDYKGSMEWNLVWIAQKLSGKRSSRFRD